MAHDHDHDVADDDFDFEDIDIKEALGLPDALPPIRLRPLHELAARARTAPMARQLAALAEWVGKDGREIDEAGDLTPDGLAEAIAALGVDATDFAFLWEYALGVEWLVFDPDDDDRVVPGETAEDWTSGDDDRVFAAWSGTMAAVLSETLDLYGPDLEADEDPDELEFDFAGQGMAIAVLLFLARREGLTVEEFAEVLWENAAGGHDEDDEEAHDEIAEARAEWEAEYGDAARLLLDKLTDTLAITETDELIRLTPLALAALHEQLVEAGVEIPLLPQTAAELSGAELLAMAGGVTDAEFEAEVDGWTAARGTEAAARELLELAATAEPGERMLAVAAVTRIGAPAEPAWRASLAVPQVRAYAKVALAQLAGVDAEGDGPADLPAELEMAPEDLAWVATDLLVARHRRGVPRPGLPRGQLPRGGARGPRGHAVRGHGPQRPPGRARRAHPPGRVPPGQAGRQGGARRRAQSRLAPRLVPANVVIGPAGNAGPMATTGEGADDDVRGKRDRPGRDRARRGLDAGEPLVRSHARLPVRRQRQRLAVRPAVRGADRHRVQPGQQRQPGRRLPDHPVHAERLLHAGRRSRRGLQGHQQPALGHRHRPGQRHAGHDDRGS